MLEETACLLRMTVSMNWKGRAKNQLMTIDQINQSFDSEWVLVEDPTTDASLEVKGGRVICHSKDREEVYRKAVEMRPKRFAMVFTGSMPPNTAIIL